MTSTANLAIDPHMQNPKRHGVADLNRVYQEETLPKLAAKDATAECLAEAEAFA